MYCAVLTNIVTQNLNTDKYVPNTYTVTEYEQIHTKIRANTYTIHTNTTGARRKPVCLADHKYIPKHTKYIPIRTNTHKNTYQYGFVLAPGTEI